MRILFVSDYYPPHSFGGYEIRCKETVNEIGSRGHEVFVLTSKTDTLNIPQESRIQRLLTLSPFRDLTLPRILPDFLRLNRRANQIKWAFQSRENYTITRKVVTTTKPDIAFIWNMQALDITPILAIQDLGIPTVYSLGAYWLLFLRKEICSESNSLKRFYRKWMKGLKDFNSLDLRHMIANSSSLKKSYIEGGFCEKDITVIPRGVSADLILDEVKQYTTNKKTFHRLLFVGRLTPDKAPDVAIESVNHLVKKLGILNVKLDLIGTGTREYLHELNKIVSDLQIQDYVEFLGNLPHEEVLNLYPGYDILLFPSRWEEPFSGTLLEAMARGLNIIATYRGGTSELISNGKNGVLVPSDDPVAIANSVFQLIKDPELAKIMKECGFKTIREKYTLDKINDQIIKYLKEVITHK